MNTLENINCHGSFGEAATSYISIIITAITILSGVLGIFTGNLVTVLNPWHLESVDL